MITSAALFALLLGSFIFLVLPRGRVWQRVASTGVFAILVAVVYGGSIELLGRPKPLRLEWRDAAHAQVLSASIREGQGIYVWLQLDGASEPQSYALPWDMKMAQQLQEAMREGQANGTDVQMNMPFGAGLDDRERKFYAMPQPPMPAKDYRYSAAISRPPA